MIKKPISPNFDHSNRFLTDYILPHQEPRNRLLVTPCFYCWISFYRALRSILLVGVFWTWLIVRDGDKNELKKSHKTRCMKQPQSNIRFTPIYTPWNVDMAKFDLSWEGYLVWQTGLSTLKGDPTDHVNVIKLKWEIIWTGGLPFLPGVPLLHVNRP